MKTKETDMGNYTLIEIDPGNEVICDDCNQAFDAGDGRSGGILFVRRAICPDCEPK